MRFRLLSATALLVATGFVGCSDVRPAATRTEVTGRVTLNGHPVAKMIMNLAPVTPGTGRTDETVVENGEFRFKVISARYKVWFTQCPGGPSVPARYRTAESAELVLDGTKSEPTNFDLN